MEEGIDAGNRSHGGQLLRKRGVGRGGGGSEKGGRVAINVAGGGKMRN